MSARLNVQILASQCGSGRTAVACENWRTGPAKLAQLGRAEQCKTELRSLFALKRALLFCYFCPRVNIYVCLFWVANSQTLFENRILDLKFCVLIEILTPNMPLIHTSFTYRKLNMDEICGLKSYLSCVHTSQKILLKSLHAQRRSFLVLNLYF